MDKKKTRKKENMDKKKTRKKEKKKKKYLWVPFTFSIGNCKFGFTLLALSSYNRMEAIHVNLNILAATLKKSKEPNTLILLIHILFNPIYSKFIISTCNEQKNYQDISSLLKK